MGLSSLFKRSKADKAEKEAGPIFTEEPAARTAVAEDRRTKTVVMRTPKVEEEEEVPVKKTAEKPAKKTAPKSTSKTASRTAAKTPAKKTAAKKTAAKKKPSDEEAGSAAGTMPPELKDLNRLLKAFAERTRTEFKPSTANAVFTEYLAKIFRDLRYRMLLIKDVDAGIMTMLRNTTDDISVKDKIAVKCVFMRKGSVGPEAIEEAQEAAALYRVDEVWCVTTTDFTDAAVRRSKKQDAKVKLIDGRKLYREFISELELD